MRTDRHISATACMEPAIIVHRMSADGKTLLDEGTTVYTGPWPRARNGSNATAITISAFRKEASARDGRPCCGRATYTVLTSGASFSNKAPQP